jgi:hypothetical protein
MFNLNFGFRVKSCDFDSCVVTLQAFHITCFPILFVFLMFPDDLLSILHAQQASDRSRRLKPARVGEEPAIEASKGGATEASKGRKTEASKGGTAEASKKGTGADG